MKKVICFFVGHKWKNFGGNQSKASWLGHLHSQAGLIEVCERCKTLWDDFFWGLDIDEIDAKIYYDERMKRVEEYLK
jgi:hypothetical protein